MSSRKLETQRTSLRRSFSELIQDDFVVLVPAAMVLGALLITTLHAGWVGSRVLFAVLATVFAWGPLAFVFLLSKALNQFRETYENDTFPHG